MEYLIDISDPEIQEAIQVLNIKPEDLKFKSLENFTGEDISSDIQEIRYNHYLTKSQACVSQIKDYLQALEAAKNPPEPVEPPHKYTVDIMKEKYAQRILKLFESEKNARLTEKELKKKLNRGKVIESRLHENVREYKKRKELIITKHKERLKSLFLQRQLQDESILERLNRTSMSPRKAKTVLKKEKPQIFVMTSEEKEIEMKLQEFNRKLLKSSENYTRNLNEKVENLKTLTKRRSTLEDTDEYEQKVMMISTKLDGAFSRRNKIQMELRERFQGKETKYVQEGRRLSEEFERNLEGMSFETEAKIDQIFVNVNKKSYLGEGKSEKMKKIEASINEKIKNLKKQEFLKKERILEKHQMIERKQLEHKQLLEITNNKIRDKAMNFTIEKEKTFAIKCLVAKSQSPEDLQRLLDKYKTKSIA